MDVTYNGQEDVTVVNVPSELSDTKPSGHVPSGGKSEKRPTHGATYCVMTVLTVILMIILVMMSVLLWKEFTVTDGDKGDTMPQPGTPNPTTSPKSCVSQPCLRGGTCNDLDTGYMCECPGGSTGKNCESDVSRKPNIIMILADDMGFADLGYTNSEVISPNIDELARTGVKLQNNYVLMVCSPSRHALLTGRYPFKDTMSHRALGGQQAHCVPTNIDMLPKKLKEVGYRTYATGKWQLGFCKKECTPLYRGFDYYFGYYEGAPDYYTHIMKSATDRSPGYDWRRDMEIGFAENGTHVTEITYNWLMEKFANYQYEDPFFLYLAFQNPHLPLQVPQRYVDMYPANLTEKRRKYLGLVTYMDEAIGGFVTTLKENGLYNNTLIYFTADNGGDHAADADCSPYRGAKGSLFEGGIKGLSFVHSPLLMKTQYTHEGLIHAIDLAPTFLSLAGAAPDSSLDGVDQSEMLLQGKPSKRNSFIINIDMERLPIYGQAAIRVDNFKLIWGGTGSTDGYGKNIELFYENPDNLRKIGVDPSNITINASPAHGYDFSPANNARMDQLTQLWAFTPDDINSGLVHLFDLTKDPYEENNLAEDPAFQEKVLELKQNILAQLPDYKGTLMIGQDPAGSPANFNGFWTSGWCDDLDITIPDRE